MQVFAQNHSESFLKCVFAGRDGARRAADPENFPEDGHHTPGTCTGTTADGFRSNPLTVGQLSSHLSKIYTVTLTTTSASI